MSTTFRLNPQQVNDVFEACLTEPDAEGAVIADLIVMTAAIDPAKVAEHVELIGAMLLELPDDFRQSVGGGWSFLQACTDRHGYLWTGEHRTMAMLFALGEVAGLVKCMFPRDMWDMLPGGVPYYQITDGSRVGSQVQDNGGSET